MSAILCLFFGVCLLAVSYQAHCQGKIRAGSGFRPFTPTRKDNPIAFHFFLCLYLLGGFALLLWGLLALLGLAEPMPLR